MATVQPSEIDTIRIFTGDREPKAGDAFCQVEGIVMKAHDVLVTVRVIRPDLPGFYTTTVVLPRRRLESLERIVLRACYRTLKNLSALSASVPPHVDQGTVRVFDGGKWKDPSWHEQL